MKLIDEFRYALWEDTDANTGEVENKCEKIAEYFAIGFAEWCIESEGKDYNKYKYRNRKELLKIYKKEKGL